MNQNTKNNIAWAAWNIVGLLVTAVFFVGQMFMLTQARNIGDQLEVQNQQFRQEVAGALQTQGQQIGKAFQVRDSVYTEQFKALQK